jgi:hypothetical protein
MSAVNPAHWTSDGRGHALGSLTGRILRRGSKIAKATLKFEKRDSASKIVVDLPSGSLLSQVSWRLCEA